MAYKWAEWLCNPYHLGGFHVSLHTSGPGGWLHNPCHLGGPQRFTAGDKIRIGSQPGLVAT